MSHIMVWNSEDGAPTVAPSKLVLLEEVPLDVRRFILKSARLEPSVPDGHLYAYAADVATATRAVRGYREAD
jgi:hypothetical protein